VQQQPTANEPPADKLAASGQIDPFLASVAKAAKRPPTALPRPPLATPWLVAEVAEELELGAETELEVVLEPELLEVVQADPSLVEELEIIATQPQGSGAARPSDPDANLNDPELLAGLLRVVVGAP
jgi:hypothetical protein